MKIREVRFYSGYRREEIPKVIETDCGVIKVEEILSSQLREEYDSGKRRRLFYFRCSEGDIYCLESLEEGYNLKKIQI